MLYNFVTISTKNFNHKHRFYRKNLTTLDEIIHKLVCLDRSKKYGHIHLYVSIPNKHYVSVGIFRFPPDISDTWQIYINVEKTKHKNLVDAISEIQQLLK